MVLLRPKATFSRHWRECEREITVQYALRGLNIFALPSRFTMTALEHSSNVVRFPNQCGVLSLTF
jgi:hypothetical protein